MAACYFVLIQEQVVNMRYPLVGLSNNWWMQSAASRQLVADGLVSWKFNFFRSYAIGHNCPASATYTGSVLHNNTNFREPLLSWFNTQHKLAVTLFNFLVGDPQWYNTLHPSRRVTLNQRNNTYTFRCGLTIQNHLEQAFPHTFRQQKLSPLASLKPAFVPFST
ncbi:hypothetical protein P9112_004551 [Eukaryota sp. TZLM1-RC]